MGDCVAPQVYPEETNTACIINVKTLELLRLIHNTVSYFAICRRDCERGSCFGAYFMFIAKAVSAF